MKSLIEFSLYLAFYFIILLLGSTWRVRVYGWKERGRPSVFAFWHSKILLLYFIFQHRGICILVSKSRDGDIAHRLLRLAGFRTVRGSSSKGGTAGILLLKRHLNMGIDVGITPDGPKGPPGVAKDGVFFLERFGKLYGLNVKVNKFWKLPTWDGMIIPRPFARIEIHVIPLSRENIPEALGEV